MESFAMKGTEILITAGKLTSGSYAKEGITVFSTEVNISSYEFVSGTKSKEAEPEPKGNSKKK